MQKFASIFLMALVLLPMMANTANAVNCLRALQKVIPCQPYLVYGASKPSDNCCEGVKDLADIANKSKSERKDLCQCLKNAAKNFPIKKEKAKALPKLCHANLNITISPDIDCNKV